jgi:U4/U6 small nuclear ribonucleoprotein PRP31
MQQPTQNTLADEFLEDFGESGDEDKQSMSNSEEPSKELKETKISKDEDSNSMQVDLKSARSAKEVSQLLGSVELNTLLDKIDRALQNEANTQSIDIDREYDLIVESNAMAVRISNDINLIHAFIRDHYSKKFPELEQLINHPLDYARIVKRIGNETNLTLIDLSDILPGSALLTLQMAATTTSGKPLTPEELEKVIEGCDMAISLDEIRKKILTYVESRMKYFAPNVTAIVGSEVAARLIGLAGGLVPLSKMPSSTIQNLGSKKRTLAGFSAKTAINHFGYIYDCDLVRRTPAALKTKICRLVGGKVTLAARVDSFREYPNGEKGQQFRAEIEKKLEKWLEPLPPKKEKSLPAPDERPRKHRGGRKNRKMRERYGMTELRKRANRIPFGPVAESDDYTFSNRLGLDKDLGMIGKAGSGSIRLRVNDGKGFRIIPKKPKGKAGQATLGTATSIYAFTPLQGLELSSVEANKALQNVKTANEKYFSTTGGFLKVQKSPSTSDKKQ